MTRAKDDKYKFCEYFPFYQILEASYLTQGESEKFKQKCALIENDYTGILNESKDICANFKYMATLFFNATESNDSEHVNGFSFLNFWLNYKLMNIPKSVVTPQQFYSNLKSKDSDFDSEKKLTNEIHVIEEKHLKNMEMLYNLYKNYNGIHNIIKDTTESEKDCLVYTGECTRIFEEANSNCLPDNIDFCRALEIFKEKYEYILRESGHKKCKLDKELPLIPYSESSRRGTEMEDDFYMPLGSDAELGDQGIHANIRNIIVVMFTLISLFLIFLVLYKVTPFGIYFRSQIKRIKKKWENIEYYDKRKSRLQDTEYYMLKEKSNELRIQYYNGDNS
ncbi:PIR Superfamily Protein [Plasmodium ovale wallikeri]|uniref:PIR Superfamily Protein n=2 Tax=Plasmodium ovale TaxID=36330 RepID=A0A1A9AIJ3_PLAOA|nr:PIR Superfamily Protein [Plasmodium ovale wallikeri]SBT58843.1 PIR Superfamily Protein [Plasmodium ovale wallikeri]SBT73731.1 PIR protein [Plasmodium ovale]